MRVKEGDRSISNLVSMMKNTSGEYFLISLFRHGVGRRCGRWERQVRKFSTFCGWLSEGEMVSMSVELNIRHWMVRRGGSDYGSSREVVGVVNGRN